MPRKPHGPIKDPIDPRREVLLAVVPTAVAFAAAAAAAWLYLFATGTFAEALFVVAVVLTGVGVVAMLVSAFFGDLTRSGRVGLIFPIIAILGMGALIPAFDRLALATRGVESECRVVATQDYIEENPRSADELRTDHEFLCAGLPSVSQSTPRDDQLPLGHTELITVDPLDRANAVFGEVSWTGGPLYLLLSFAIVAIATISRLYLVDDGQMWSAVRSRFRRGEGS